MYYKYEGQFFDHRSTNGALQLGIEDRKDSIETDKDADFLVFDRDLFASEKDGFSNNLPQDVYFGGKKVNGKEKV